MERGPDGHSSQVFYCILAQVAPRLSAVRGWGRSEGWGAKLEGLTAGATGFLVTAVHAVGICITAPAQGDAVTTLALELVHVTARCTIFLWAREQASWSDLGTPVALP